MRFCGRVQIDRPPLFHSGAAARRPVSDHRFSVDNWLQKPPLPSAGEEVLAFLFSLAAQRHHGDIKGCVIDQQMTEFAVVDNYVDSLARSSSKTQKFAC